MLKYGLVFSAFNLHTNGDKTNQVLFPPEMFSEVIPQPHVSSVTFPFIELIVTKEGLKVMII